MIVITLFSSKNNLTSNSNNIIIKTEQNSKLSDCQNFTTANKSINISPHKTKKQHETKYLNLRLSFYQWQTGKKKLKPRSCLIEQTEAHIVIGLLCRLLFLLFLLSSCRCCTSCICSSCNWCQNSKLAGILFNSSKYRLISRKLYRL